MKVASARLACAVAASTMFGLISDAAQAELVYAVDNTQTLLSLDSSDSTNILTGAAISGLVSNEVVLGIDFRPANNQLYALGSFGNLYTLNLTTAVLPGTPRATLNGTSFGFDFNPVIDRIRVVSDANNNSVYNPNDGTSTAVTSLFYAAGDPNFNQDPNVISSAYTNSVSGAGSTQLYGIDTNVSGDDFLVTQANSAGTLNTVAAITSASVGGPMDLTAIGEFDISGQTGIAYIAVGDNASTTSTFWTIDLNTAVATFAGDIGDNGSIGGGKVITAIAVIPEPATAALLVLGLAGTMLRRRR